MIHKSKVLFIQQQQALCRGCGAMGEKSTLGPEGAFIGAPECQCDWVGWSSYDFGVSQETHGFGLVGGGLIVEMPFIPRSEIVWV